MIENLGKEKDICRYREAHRVSNKMNPSRPTRRSVIIVWQSERQDYRGSRETKESVTRSSHKAISIFLCGNDAGQNGVS